MLRPRAAGESLPQLAEAARERARALRGVIENVEHPYGQLLGRELAHIDSAGDSSLLHDYLAEHNRAYWFREFAALAAGSGFHYLTEAAFTQPDYRVPPVIRETASSLESDRLAIEELIDLLWYRQHRTSLFCREGAQGAAPSHEALFDRITLAAGCRPRSEEIRLEPGIEETFSGMFEPDVTTTSSHPLDKAALAILAAAWPLGLGWRELVTESRRQIRASGIEEPDADA